MMMVLELGCLLDWLRTGVTGSPTVGFGVPSWVQDCCCPPGDWHLGFLPGADWARKGGWGPGAVGGDSFSIDSPLSQQLLAGAC